MNKIILKKKKDTKPRDLRAGDAAPEFSLPDQKGKRHTFSDYRGKWAVVYFYPKDDTPGCTKEACGIRDAFPDFKKLKAEVFGISVDDEKSHTKFIKKYKLPFTLLADTEKRVVGEYGVWGKKKFMGKTYTGTLRTTFLIDNRALYGLPAMFLFRSPARRGAPSRVSFHAELRSRCAFEKRI